MGYCTIHFPDNLDMGKGVTSRILSDLVAIVDVHGHDGIRFSNAESLQGDELLIIKGKQDAVERFVGRVSAKDWFDSCAPMTDPEQIAVYDRKHEEFDMSFDREVNKSQGANGKPNFG